LNPRIFHDLAPAQGSHVKNAALPDLTPLYAAANCNIMRRGSSGMIEPDHRRSSARATPHPWVWGILYFPLGLAIGFPSVGLGYLGAQSGLGVSAVAAIVGMTFLASGWQDDRRY
jgi:hypothetical protein